MPNKLGGGLSPFSAPITTYIIMKKQLTKSQIETRKKILNKVKNIILYCSLALNLLVFICLLVSACAPKSSRSRNTNNLDTTNLVLPKKQLRSNDSYDIANDDTFNIWDNKYTVGYDLYRPSANRFTHSWTILSNLSTSSSLIVVNSGTTIAYDYFLVRVNMRNPSQSGDYIEVLTRSGSALGLYRGFYFNSTSYTTYNTPPSDSYFYGSTPAYNSDNGFVVLFNNEYLKSSGLGTGDLLSTYFNSIKYKDYDLSTNWSPFSYYRLTYGVAVNESYQRLDYLIRNSALAVNGVIYTDMIVEWDYIESDGNSIHVVVPGQEELVVWNQNVSYIKGVYYYNRFTNASTPYLWSMTFGVSDNGQSTDRYIYPSNARITSYSLAYVRLFDVNSNLTSSITGYFNSNVLNVTYYYTGTNITDASSTGVFGLLKTAFASLTGIFEIYILPGITIGILMFTPLVVIVIISVLRMIKK